MSVRVATILAVLALALGGLWLLFTGGGDPRTPGAAPDASVVEVPALARDLRDAGASDPVAAAEPAGEAGRSAVVAPVSEGTESSTEMAADAEAEVDRATVAILSGYVHDERNRPVEGAELVAARSAMELLAVDSVFSLGDLGQAADRFCRARTDERGFFELVGIPPGQPALQVTAAGHVPHTKVDLFVAAREHRALASPIVLDASAVATGVVLDPNGAPVADAKVTTKKKKAGLMGTAMAAMADGGVRTAADGTFRLDSLEPEELEVVVTHAAFTIASVDLDAREATTIEGLEVRLERGASIRGRVVGADADVAAGLQVVAFPEDFSPTQGMSPRLAAVASDGSFELGGMAEGSAWNVYGREHDDEAPSMASMWMGGEAVTDRVEASAGGERIELAYRPALTVTFEVVDAATKRPITRLRVHEQEVFWGGTPKAEDHPGGRVRLEGLRAGEEGASVTVFVDADGYRSRVEQIDSERGPEVDLGVLPLEPAVVARFHVVDAATGASIPGAKVRLSRRLETEGLSELAAVLPGGSGDQYSGDESGESDDEGEAMVETSLDGAYRVSVTADDYAPLALVDVDLVGTDVTPMRLELGRGTTVRVLALDAGGTPLPARTIEHAAPDEEVSFDWTDSATDRVTDAAGVATFLHLAEGEHRFRLAKLESASTEPNMMMFLMAARESMDEDDDSWTTLTIAGEAERELELVELPTGGLRGRITEAGEPLARATLTLRSLDAPASEPDEDLDAAEAAFLEMGEALGAGGGPSARTERDGGYAFEGVDVGRYVLSVDHRKRAMRAEYEVTVVAGDQVLDVDLDLVVVSGVVVDAAGEGVKGALVGVRPFVEDSEEEGPSNAELAQGLMGEILGVEGEVRTFKTRRGGKFELRGVAPGVPLVVHVDGAEAGFQSAATEPFEVGRDETRDDLRIVLARGGSIDVTVLDADGSRAQFVLVRLERPDGAFEPRNELAMDGAKLVTGLPPGTYRVLADDEPDEEAIFGGGDPSTLGKVSATVEVVGGETVKLELRLP